MTDPQPSSSASSAASVDALMSRWDAARHHGQTLSPEELCRDCPQYLAELQSRIDGLQVMERFMAKAGPARDDSLPLSASDAETGFNGPALKTVEEAKSCLSPPRGPDEIGWLGTYCVRKVLGAGGMGVVLLAEDSRLKRQVAVKIMAPSLAANTSARERFLREAQAAAALEHEHIVAIHQVDEHNNVPYLVMPFLKGESLEDRLARVGRLELLDAVRIAREIAEGLAAAHEHGLIHRDIKPGNIWMETRSQRSGIRSQESGGRGQGAGTEKTEIRETPASSDQWLRTKVERVKILDFGLARAERNDVHLTRTGEVLGTPAYMCPEQAAGEVVDQRGDLFSLGAVVYRMVTGQRPFAGDTIFAMMNALANQQPQAPEKLNPDTPPPLSRLILRLLEKDRSRRPASALEVANELAGIEVTCFEETEVQGSATALPNIAPQTLPQPPERRRRKPRTAIAIAALAALALLAAGIIVIIRDREGNEIARIKVPKDGSAIIEQKGKPPIVIPEKPPAKAKDPHRRAAEMVLKHGGKVHVLTPSHNDITRLEHLPAGPFVLHSIYLPGKTIPDDVLKAVADVAILFDLSIPYAVTGDTVMRQLKQTELIRLQLAGAKVTDEGSELLLQRRGLVILHAPDTLGTRFSFEKMAGLSSLRFLELPGWKTTPEGLRALASAPMLARLQIYGPWTGAEVAQLRNLPCLRELVVIGPDATDDLIGDLAKLKHVTYIQLHNTRITDEGARRLQKALANALIYHPAIDRTEGARAVLRWVLDSGGTVHGSVKDDLEVRLQKVPAGLFRVERVIFSPPGPPGGAAKLVALPELGLLTWQDLKNADAEAEHLSALSGLQNLRLPSSDITAKGLKKLTALRRLEQLQLSYSSKLAGDAWQHLPAFNVGILNLDGTPIDDQGLAHVAASSHLQYLDLSSCSKITAAGLDHLSKLPALRVLDLAYNPLTADAVAPLKKLSNVRILDLRNTKLTAAGIAELRKALPKCAIFWDGPAVIPGAETASPFPPLHPAWVKKVQAMKPEEQVKEVAAELKRRNPGFDGKFTHLSDAGSVVEFAFNSVNVADITPIQALRKLEKLRCAGAGIGDKRGRIADLSPLKGMPLRYLHCAFNPISDLGPLAGLPLEQLFATGTSITDLTGLQGLPRLQVLDCSATGVSDLTPVKGLPLSTLQIYSTKVTDLKSLQGMSLLQLNIVGTTITDLKPLQTMRLKSLTCQSKHLDLPLVQSLNLKELWIDDFQAERDIPTLRSLKTLEKINRKPAAEFWKEQGYGPFPALDPGWVKKVHAMKPEEQVKEVAAELKLRNPGFDGNLKYELKDNVWQLTLSSDQITDLSPIRAFSELKALLCRGDREAKSGRLCDLSPLAGLQLTNVEFAHNRLLTDLEPLRGMPLISIRLTNTGVAHLGPLRDCVKLTALGIEGTRVADLEPLRERKMLLLYLSGAPLRDISILASFPLKYLNFEPRSDGEFALLRSIKTLETINGVPAAQFWKQRDAKPAAPFTNALGMKLVAIPAGEFLMGSAKDEADYHDFEGPRHRVVFSKPFFMSAHEITQEQYQKIVGRNPSANKADPGCPVENVSWENAVDFCERLSQNPDEKKHGRVYRLPTEAEWEYACRAGTATAFHFGASLSTAQANFGALLDFGRVEKGAPGKTVKVGSYPPNAWGLFDMHGNVREWCLDGARPFKKTDDGIANPQGPTNEGLARVCRGGHFSTSAAGCRSALRQSVAALARQPVTGFRVVCTQRPLGPGR